jgi:endoglucanase
MSTPTPVLQNTRRGAWRRSLAFAVGACAFVLPATAQTLPMLHAGGTHIVDSNNNVVLLKGTNLGAWLVMEKWMCPLDSGSVADTYGLLQTLDNRFGVATEQSLIKGYQQNWITTTDLDNIKARGLNVVRVPVWWGDFFTLASYGDSTGWRSDAFTQLDWLVSNCATRGIYVIIDMHGVVGGQSTSDTCGQQNSNAYWANTTYQSRTAWMWSQIAAHFKGNTTVAAYDVMNEPTGAPNTNAVWTAYNSLYGTIRAADPDHMIIMEGTFGSWNWSMLPAPSTYGWTNVAYEMHEYQWHGGASKVKMGSDNQVKDFQNHQSWNVPGYVGEFNDFGNGVSTWQYSINDYTNAGLSWSMWSYKATHGLVPDSWGIYDPTYWPTTPNVSTDSSTTIANDWAQWQTTVSFGYNSTDGI